MALSSGALAGAALAGASGVLVLAGLATGYRRRTSADRALVSKATESAETGRRLAIYERETGLLAHWYVTLRGKEECERAARYRRPISLFLAEIAPEADPKATQEQLPHCLRKNFRRVDIIGYLGNGRYVVLMPESDIAGARLAATRFQDTLSGVDIALSELPTDGTTFDQLYAVASQRLGKPIEKAA
jgi:GGDEF domain-containing protein